MFYFLEKAGKNAAALQTPVGLRRLGALPPDSQVVIFEHYVIFRTSLKLRLTSVAASGPLSKAWPPPWLKPLVTLLVT